MSIRGRHVIFIRKEGFYPVQLHGAKPVEEECADHARLNPGTLRIDDALTGDLLWPKETLQ